MEKVGSLIGGALHGLFGKKDDLWFNQLNKCWK